MPRADEASESTRSTKRVRVSEIKKLLALMEDHGLEELEVADGEFRVRLKKAGASAPAPAVEEPIPPAPKDEAWKKRAAPAGEMVSIRANLVGTFYRAPAPDAPSYVEPGDPVDENTAVCIIEAMKVMNEVKAGVVGTIQRILVENAATVEYGQPLFEVMP